MLVTLAVTKGHRRKILEDASICTQRRRRAPIHPFLFTLNVIFPRVSWQIEYYISLYSRARRRRRRRRYRLRRGYSTSWSYFSPIGRHLSSSLLPIPLLVRLSSGTVSMPGWYARVILQSYFDRVSSNTVRAVAFATLEVWLSLVNSQISKVTRAIKLTLLAGIGFWWKEMRML